MTDHPTPTCADIDAFCKADEWTEVRTTDHVHWEKALPNGAVLKTHRSLAPNKVIKPGRFGVILRDQLQVSRAEFWQAVNSGTPVDRPVEPDDAPTEYPAWVIWGLKAYGHDEEAVRSMTPEEATSLLWAKRSEPSS